MIASQLKVDIFHNVLWAKYKGDIFKEILSISQSHDTQVRIFQIAETELSRLSLGQVNRQEHEYKFQLLFEGPYENISIFQLCRRLVGELLNSDAQVVVLPGYHRFEHWLMLLTAKLKYKRVLVFCDSTALDNHKMFFKEILKKIFFRGVDGVLCYGTASAQYVQSYIPRTQFNKVYYPCSSASIPNESYDVEDVKAQRQFLISQDVKQFLFVGRLSEEKGILDLLDAWASSEVLRTKHCLKIAGDGPQKADLQNRIIELGIETSVSLLGACSKAELNQLYKQSYVMVLPSYSEPWGLVVNEAYYFGCPVIMSDHCGCMKDLAIEPDEQVFPVRCNVSLAKRLETITKYNEYLELCISINSVIRMYTPKAAAHTIVKSICKSY